MEAKGACPANPGLMTQTMLKPFSSVTGGQDVLPDHHEHHKPVKSNVPRSQDVPLPPR